MEKCSPEALREYVRFMIREDERTDMLENIQDAIAEIETMAAVDWEIMPPGIDPEEFMQAWNETIKAGE